MVIAASVSVWAITARDFTVGMDMGGMDSIDTGLEVMAILIILPYMPIRLP